jgi:hypothetical protein
MPDNMRLLDEIEEARARNNVVWMDIVRLAMLARPEVTKTLLLKINENDKFISEKLGQIANG